MIHVNHVTGFEIDLIYGGRNALHLIDAARSLYAQAKEPKGLIEITGAPRGRDRARRTGHTVPITRIIDWFQRSRRLRRRCRD
jgi:hypothetical protein